MLTSSRPDNLAAAAAGSVEWAAGVKPPELSQEVHSEQAGLRPGSLPRQTGQPDLNQNGAEKMNERRFLAKTARQVAARHLQLAGYSSSSPVGHHPLLNCGILACVGLQ